MENYNLEHTFVTSDHHFYLWKTQFGGVFGESSEEDDARHIELWNSVVGKDDLVLYVGDFCDGEIASLEALHKKLNGRKVLIKGNHDRLDDEWYRFVFEDVVNELRIDELNLRLIHIKEEASERRPGERLIYGHDHRSREIAPATTRDSICACAKWHDWKPITLVEAFRKMEEA
jgi:calcineurin-like phosphoesterase family protein